MGYANNKPNQLKLVRYTTIMEQEMEAYIQPPKRIPWFLRFPIWIAEHKTGKVMLVARILSWYPKGAFGAGILESLVAHKDKKVTQRILKLIRMQVSFKASCPFCIDMNSSEYAKLNITMQEIQGLQGLLMIEDIDSFTLEEKIAIKYSIALTETPIKISRNLLNDLMNHFTEREIVIIVTTVAQVNFWTRLVQGVGVPPAGFSAACTNLNIAKYNTLVD